MAFCGYLSTLSALLQNDSLLQKIVQAWSHSPLCIGMFLAAFSKWSPPCHPHKAPYQQSHHHKLLDGGRRSTCSQNQMVSPCARKGKRRKAGWLTGSRAERRAADLDFPARCAPPLPQAGWRWPPQPPAAPRPTPGWVRCAGRTPLQTG